jgi:hypothetical protein
MTSQHNLLTDLAPWAGPFWSWVANAVVWALGGMSPLAALGALAALWWTVERAKTERARRKMIENLGVEVKAEAGITKRLRAALKTKPGEL